MTPLADADVVSETHAQLPPGSALPDSGGGVSSVHAVPVPDETSGRASWTTAQRIHLVALTIASSCIIGFRLNRPDRLYFDEKHYVPDAQEIWARGAEIERLAHPPWGKILIGAGIEVVGDNPVGWRIVPAIAGIVIVLFSYLATRSITGRHGVAIFVGALVALDGLIIAMSRIAMLDIIAAAHVVVAFVLLLEDRQRRDAEAAGDQATGLVLPRPIVRHSRWVAAAVLGFAVATKWTAAPALVAMGLIVLVWDLRRSGETSHRRSPRHRAPLGRLVGRWVATFVVLPGVVYVGAHAAWIINYDRTQTAAERCVAQPCDSGPVDVVEGWIQEQTSKIEFQQRLIIKHPYRSEAIGWPALERPVLLYNESCPPGAECGELAGGQQKRIVSLGNVVLWWSAIAAAPVVAVQVLRRRQPAGSSALVVAAAQWVPWVFSPNPGFLFYMTPVVPFMAIVLGTAVAAIERTRLRRVVMWSVVAAATAVFAFQYPVWTGLPLADGGIDARLFIDSWR